ncbi:hypothetical protein DSUL_160025 [Desulfovibrionales bacterium]
MVICVEQHILCHFYILVCELIHFFCVSTCYTESILVTPNILNNL